MLNLIVEVTFHIMHAHTKIVAFMDDINLTNKTGLSIEISYCLVKRLMPTFLLCNCTSTMGVGSLGSSDIVTEMFRHLTSAVQKFCEGQFENSFIFGYG